MDNSSESFGNDSAQVVNIPEFKGPNICYKLNHDPSNAWGFSVVSSPMNTGFRQDREFEEDLKQWKQMDESGPCSHSLHIEVYCYESFFDAELLISEKCSDDRVLRRIPLNSGRNLTDEQKKLLAGKRVLFTWDYLLDFPEIEANV